MSRQVLGRRPRYVPSPLARRFVRGAWRLRATGFPPPELRHVQYNGVVDGTLARKVLGFEPAYGLVETIRSVLDYAV